MILDIGYMLAGWTTRKQALHDMLAGTLVVFRDVQPGQPLPTVRPPMPWYGWLLNLVLVGGCVLGVLALFHVRRIDGTARVHCPAGRQRLLRCPTAETKKAAQRRPSLRGEARSAAERKQPRAARLW